MFRRQFEPFFHAIFDFCCRRRNARLFFIKSYRAALTIVTSVTNITPLSPLSSLLNIPADKIFTSVANLSMQVSNFQHSMHNCVHRSPSLRPLRKFATNHSDFNVVPDRTGIVFRRPSVAESTGLRAIQWRKSCRPGEGKPDIRTIGIGSSHIDGAGGSVLKPTIRNRVVSSCGISGNRSPFIPCRASSKDVDRLRSRGCIDTAFSIQAIGIDQESACRVRLQDPCKVT